MDVVELEWNCDSTILLVWGRVKENNVDIRPPPPKKNYLSSRVLVMYYSIFWSYVFFAFLSPSCFRLLS